MKAIIPAVLSLLLFLASCNKHCDDHTVAPQADSWTFMSTSYHAAKSVRVAGSGTSDLIFLKDDTAPQLPNLTFRFTKYPTATGTYKVVSYPHADDEVGIYYLVGDDVSGGDYSSGEIDNAHLEVKVENGKLRFYSDRLVMHGSVYIGARYERADLAFNLTEF